MAFNPTNEQRDAINTDGNILVAAAAGSGKTAVLVERVIRKLTDPIAPISADKLLVVTFTNMAAAEMRQRIEKRLYDECKAHPDDSGLREQKRLIASAQICTIDSFCINLVRENFEKLGLEPDFKMGDNSTIDIISNSVLNDVILEYMDDFTDDFKLLLEITNCEYDDSNLKKVIKEIFNYSRQMPFPNEFLSALKEPYEKPFDENHVWYKECFRIAAEYVDAFGTNVDAMSECAKFVVNDPSKRIEYADDAQVMSKNIKSAFDGGNWDEVYSAVSRSVLEKAPNANAKDQATVDFSAYRAKAIKALDKLKGFFAFSLEGTEKQYKKLSPAICLLIDIVFKYADALFEKFKSENIMTFYNTEQLALSLLCKSENGVPVIREEAEELLDRYEEVLVDEFQDVNDLQDALFYALSDREKKLFVVGDVKQSIYGFRGSNPANFLRKKNSYIPIEKSKDSESKKIILSDNFRSKAGVCQYVNFFFELMMSGQIGDIVYNAEERLRPSATYPECAAPASEVIVVESGDKKLNADEAFALEARCIARYIKKVMNEGEVIKCGDNELRKASYSDFTILLRSMKRAGILAKELKAMGVPVDYSPESFSESIEISTFLSLLKVIDNPENDIELLCVAMSPIFGFTAEHLANIRAEHKYSSLYSAFLHAAKAGDEKVSEFISSLSDMRRYASTVSVDRLISFLLTVTDYLNIASVMPSGSQRRANLITLTNIASEYTSSFKGGISGFLRYVSQLDDKDIKISNTSGGDSVHIMTIHKSKGLQFPICIVAELSKQINDTDANSSMIFDDTLGISFRYFDESKGNSVDCLGRMLLSYGSHITNIEEQLRLYYVALTRAENRIVQVMYVSNCEKKLDDLASMIGDTKPYLSASCISSLSTIRDWVLITSLFHPSADNLRNRCGVSVPVVGAEGDLSITFMKDEETEFSDSKREEPESNIDEEIVSAIKESISYAYPFDKLRTIRAKSSVSALVGAAENEKYNFTEKPAFMEKEGLSAAGKGTAMHKIMQYIKLDEKPDIEAEIERLVEWQYISEQEGEAADRKLLGAFFDSDVFRRILLSNDVRREMRFLTEIPAIELDPTLDGVNEEERIIVQGAVDLCFVEDDGIVILDFKTDRSNDASHFIESYAEQLNIYAKACEKIFLKPVKDKIIYSFFASKEIHI